jgi:hypothetical protein
MRRSSARRRASFFSLSHRLGGSSYVLRHVLGRAGLAFLLAGWGAGALGGTTVEMVNASRPTRCAEEDNVYVKFFGADINRFRLTVRHPRYIGAIASDVTAPDFTRCDMSQDPSFPFTPRTVTLYDDGTYVLVGHTFPTNWRPDIVPFHVAGRDESGLHLVQLFRRVGATPIEFLVLYPADGYWRAKPLPPPNLAEGAYGSSFLFGPIEEQGRPFVALSDIAFDPATLTFALRFAAGGSGALRVAEVTPTELALDIRFDPSGERPFAALRSMFVTPAQADVGEAEWKAADATPVTRPIMDFDAAAISEVRFGRRAKSHHNLSAPDYVFGPFSGGTAEP